MVFTIWNTLPDWINWTYSLEYRRLVADLILTYQIIFGLVDIDPNDYFCLKGSDNTRLRGNPYEITVNQCLLNVRKNLLASVLL